MSVAASSRPSAIIFRSRHRYERIGHPRDVEWQEQLDLDSMNLLTMMVEIESATGISVPERDYPKVSTLNRCVEYLTGRTATIPA